MGAKSRDNTSTSVVYGLSRIGWCEMRYYMHLPPGQAREVYAIGKVTSERYGDRS